MMVVAVDTNILLDIVLPDQTFAEQSYSLLTSFMQRSPLIICDVVYGELAAVFDDQELLNSFLETANIRVVPNSRSVLWEAGQAWQLYNHGRTTRVQCTACSFTAEYICDQCGHAIRTRQPMIADFLIGAHAAENANLLLTRDRGVFKRYFPDLLVQAKL